MALHELITETNIVGENPPRKRGGKRRAIQVYLAATSQIGTHRKTCQNKRAHKLAELRAAS